MNYITNFAVYSFRNMNFSGYLFYRHNYKQYFVFPKLYQVRKQP